MNYPDTFFFFANPMKKRLNWFDLLLFQDKQTKNMAICKKVNKCERPDKFKSATDDDDD